jgi:hypothetical protein
MKGVLPAIQLFLKRNSSTILTCIGAAGVVGTAVLAVKATPKATAMLVKAEEEKGEKLTKLEIVKTAGPAYIPSIAMGASTIACIFGANVLNKRHQAALVSAYGLLENSYREYKKKVQEVFGEDAHTKILERMAEDKPEQEEQTDDGKVDFLDFLSLQFFRATWEDVQRAEDKINAICQAKGYALLSQLYEEFGIECVDVEYDLGWTSNMGYIEFDYDTITMQNGSECAVISIANEPIPLH